MNRQERRGAIWFAAGVLLMGLMLWLAGRCSREAEQAAETPAVMVVDAADSLSGENVEAGKSRRKRGKSGKRSSGKKRGNRKSRGPSAAIEPYRDILADTIANEPHGN